MILSDHSSIRSKDGIFWSINHIAKGDWLDDEYRLSAKLDLNGIILNLLLLQAKAELMERIVSFLFFVPDSY